MLFETSSSFDLNGRAAMIFSAVASPTPGSFMRSSRLAELRSTLGADLCALEDFVDFAFSVVAAGLVSVAPVLDPSWANASGALSRPTARVSSARDLMRDRSEEHTSELQSLRHLVCRLLLEKK